MQFYSFNNVVNDSTAEKLCSNRFLSAAYTILGVIFLRSYLEFWDAKKRTFDWPTNLARIKK